jgi:type I restriction enzyme S subunit
MRWNSGNFVDREWKWPLEYIRPISDALKNKQIEITRQSEKFGLVKMATLRFDGSMEPRDTAPYEIKGKLYLAEPGDLVFSKIDVRNGAIGIVPETIPLAAFTSEFPIYRVRENVALAEYIALLFRAAFFRRTINAMISGASGRKRVQPTQLTDIEIPLPPLDVQRAIVRKWQNARAAIKKLEQEAKQIEDSISLLVYEHLDVPKPNTESAKCRVMAITWSELERWSFNYLKRAKAGLLGFVKSRYPIEPLQEHLLETMNGYCIKPVGREASWKMLKLSALQPAGLNLNEVKYVEVSEKIGKRFSIQKGDLLICRSVGSYEMVEKCALVEEDMPDVLFPDIIIRARFRNSLLPAYVREIMQTPLGRSFFQSNARTAVGMWKIGATDIENFPIPVPPLEAQQAIVDTIGNARQQAAEARKKAEDLKTRTAAEIEAAILGGGVAPSGEIPWRQTCGH